MNDVFAIIPAYNEQRNIGAVIRKTKRVCGNIIIVDDGSSDRTRELADRENVIVLHHIVNLGKGAALKTGCEYAVRLGAKRVVILDADGQHDPLLIPKFASALRKADIVFGYRTFNHRMPLVMNFGNRMINLCMKLVHGVDVRDILCGYRSWKTAVYDKILWESQDYEVETEIVARAARQNLRYAQLPVPTVYLDKYKGTTPLDGLKIMLKIVALRWSR